MRSRPLGTKGTVFVAAGVGVLVILVSWWLGNAYWLVGLGSGLGVWLGVRWGNKKAREVDEYRKEWLAKRSGTQPPAGAEDEGKP